MRVVHKYPVRSLERVTVALVPKGSVILSVLWQEGDGPVLYVEKPAGWEDRGPVTKGEEERLMSEGMAQLHFVAFWTGNPFGLHLCPPDMKFIGTLESPRGEVVHIYGVIRE